MSNPSKGLSAGYDGVGWDRDNFLNIIGRLCNKLGLSTAKLSRANLVVLKSCLKLSQKKEKN